MCINEEERMWRKWINHEIQTAKEARDRAFAFRAAVILWGTVFGLTWLLWGHRA